jgi:hypothetical protein
VIVGMIIIITIVYGKPFQIKRLFAIVIIFVLMDEVGVHIDDEQRKNREYDGWL